MPEDAEFLLLDEVARRCRVPVSTVRHWIALKKLPSGKFVRRRLVRREDLERFIAAGFTEEPTTSEAQE
jgi:excisionase family DNA binding protein